MTPDELFTRCPTCKTVYRTHEEQLSVQAGKVRCGQCRMVFDGRAHLVDLAPQRDLPPDERDAGPPTVTLRRAADLSAADDEAASSARAAPADDVPESSAAAAGSALAAEPTPAATDSAPIPPTIATPDADAAPADGPATAPPASDAPASGPHARVPASLAPAAIDAASPSATQPEPEIVMPAWEESVQPQRRGMRWVYGAFALLLLAALAAQAVFHFRHILAARYPPLRPHLVAACAAIGCLVEPLRNRDEITIESHDLQADPAHQGLLILQTTLRNQSGHPLAFPHLELELNDLGGQPVVRRVFAPVEYAGGAADFAKGIPANAEWNVKLFIDASSVSAGGYNLYLFYP